MHAWFSGEIAPFFSFFSLVAVIAAFDPLAERGERRALVTGVYLAATALGAALLLLCTAAFAMGQPGYVQFTLGFSGAVIFVVCLAKLIKLGSIYREAEMRRTVARDL